MSHRSTHRSPHYDKNDIHSVRKELARLRSEMHELVSKGAFTTEEDKKERTAHYAELKKQVKKQKILIRELKNKEGGRRTHRRQRQTRRKTKRSRK